MPRINVFLITPICVITGKSMFFEDNGNVLCKDNMIFKGNQTFCCSTIERFNYN